MVASTALGITDTCCGEILERRTVFSLLQHTCRCFAKKICYITTSKFTLRSSTISDKKHPQCYPRVSSHYCSYSSQRHSALSLFLSLSLCYSWARMHTRTHPPTLSLSLSQNKCRGSSALIVEIPCVKEVPLFSSLYLTPHVLLATMEHSKYCYQHNLFLCNSA